MTTMVPVEVTPRLEALLYLKHVVFPHMRKENTLVDLDLYEGVEECGTYRCVLGWYNHLRYRRPFSLRWMIDQAFPEFTDGDFLGMFGTARHGGLEVREAYLDREIAAELEVLASETTR